MSEDIAFTQITLTEIVAIIVMICGVLSVLLKMHNDSMKRDAQWQQEIRQIHGKLSDKIDRADFERQWDKLHQGQNKIHERIDTLYDGS